MTDKPLFQLTRTFDKRFVGPSTHAPWLRYVASMDLTVGDAYRVHFAFQDPHGALKLESCEVTDLKTGKKETLLDPYTTNEQPLPEWQVNADHPTSVRGFAYDSKNGLVTTNESMCKCLYERLDETHSLKTIACLITENGDTRGLLFNFLDRILYTVTDEGSGFTLRDTTMDGNPVVFLNASNLCRGAKYFNPEKEKEDESFAQRGFVLIRQSGNIHS